MTPTAPTTQHPSRIAARAASPASRIVLAALFAFAGTMHFVIPDSYVRIMPAWLPWHRGLVFVSGACEIAGGLGLLVPQVRRWAGIGLVLLLLAVWPANAQMWMNARAAHQSGWAQALLLLRLPMQIVLMMWVWRASHPRALHVDTRNSVDA
ncbi:DoxX family protein [Longimicrobium sp.]|uniref:DoxX family protein n=1 Tax=Longimicrobium sp. TaxID=2029185 RepID=UPI002CC7A88B|nr:DoxX family protein [Longimicrobium sp.]HSU13379.1 DoxX family protein [Longimicrobium sp.]